MKKPKRLRLFLLTQRENTGYDTVDSIVVAAHAEDDAKEIHPYNNWRKGSISSKTWASSPKNVVAELIGVAEPHVERGIILTSFNAG